MQATRSGSANDDDLMGHKDFNVLSKRAVMASAALSSIDKADSAKLDGR